jgi:hypothetical protein
MNKELSLEDAWDNSDAGDFFTQARGPIVLEPQHAPWMDNQGECPVEDTSTIVDVMFRVGEVVMDNTANSLGWKFQGGDDEWEIVKWRYHNAEDYYKQPKTIPKAEGENIIWNLANGSSIEFADEPPKRNKYMREIKPNVWVDVYDVLRAFTVTDPCLQHLLKKALAVGQRGHKDAAEDYKDIVDSAVRAQGMNKEWNPLKTCLDFPLVQP